jgi:hypothetical protein
MNKIETPDIQKMSATYEAEADDFIIRCNNDKEEWEKADERAFDEVALRKHKEWIAISDRKQEEAKKKYPTCVDCGTTKKDPGYHWCYVCFRKWEDKNNGVKVATKCLIVEDD